MPDGRSTQKEPSLLCYAVAPLRSQRIPCLHAEAPLKSQRIPCVRAVAPLSVQSLSCFRSAPPAGGGRPFLWFDFRFIFACRFDSYGYSGLMQFTKLNSTVILHPSR